MEKRNIFTDFDKLIFKINFDEIIIFPKVKITYFAQKAPGLKHKKISLLIFITDLVIVCKCWSTESIYPVKSIFSSCFYL